MSAIVSGYRDKRLAINHTAARVFTVILRTVFLVGMCFVMLYPVLFMISSGFRNLQDVYDPTVVWLPKHWTLDSLKLAATAMDYGESIVMTLVTVIPSVLLQLITVLLAGYGFARFHFRGRGLLFGLLIFTIIVPVQSYIIPLVQYIYKFRLFRYRVSCRLVHRRKADHQPDQQACGLLFAGIFGYGDPVRALHIHSPTVLPRVPHGAGRGGDDRRMRPYAYLF